MASKLSKSLPLFLVLNLLFFTLISACGDCGSGGGYTKPAPQPKPKPTPKPSPSGGYPGSSSTGFCQSHTLKLGVCAKVLGGLLDVVIGTPPKQPCCSLVKGLIDAEAAICLCTAIKANVLGINLNVPISLTALVNYCDCKLPKGFHCA